MKYDNITKGRFISRPNRFIATAEIDGRTETIRTSDDKRQITARVHLFLEPVGILNGAELAPVFVKQDDVRRRHETREDGFAFGGLELLLSQRLGILDIRDDDELKRHIMGEPLPIVVDERLQARITRFPQDQQCYLHR